MSGIYIKGVGMPKMADGGWRLLYLRADGAVFGCGKSRGFKRLEGVVAIQTGDQYPLTISGPEKGRWIDNRREPDGEWMCSKCGNEGTICILGKDITPRTAFCPWCGADMRGGRRNERRYPSEVPTMQRADDTMDWHIQQQLHQGPDF